MIGTKYLLEQAMWNTRKTVPYNHVDISLIVMHPKTWNDLVNELYHDLDDLCFIDAPHVYAFEYKGIKVLRSTDVKEKEFEIA